MTALLKECRDIQLRCGSSTIEFANDTVAIADLEVVAESDAEKIISERLVCLIFLAAFFPKFSARL